MKRLLLFVALLAAVPLFVVAEPPAKADEKDKAAKEQFIKVVKANAQDPAGLEIISWGERKLDPAIGMEVREVKFRCAVIAYKRGTQTPIKIDHASIEYKGDTIFRVYLVEGFAIWFAE